MTTWRARVWSIDSPYAVIWILALAALMVMTGLGLRDPWPADEPRFAQVAREMVQSGQWLFPTRGGELYSDKPPVFMWLIASFYALTDNLRVAFLLPSALAGLGTLFCLHDLTRRLWDVRIANVAALLLLACLQFTLQAKTAQIDALVCFWITLGCYGLLRHLLLGPALGWYLTGWFAMGLGVITKGVGFLPMLLLIPTAGLWLTQARVQLAPPRLTLLFGPLALLAAIALWFVPMILAVEASGDPAWIAYRDDIVFRQTAERYADSWSHLNPWYYYIVSVIPLFWMPVSVLLPWLIRPWYRYFVEREPRVIIPLVWVVLVVVFFSLSPGKRGVYVLPALPMLVLATAPIISTLYARQWPRRILLATLGLVALLFVVVGVAGISGLEVLSTAAARSGIVPWSLLLTVGLVASLATFITWRKRPAFGWFVFVVPLWVLYGTWGYALVNPGRTPAPVYREMLRQVDKDFRLGLVDFREQWLLFAPVPITHFGFSTSEPDQVREAWRWLGETGNDGLPRRLLLSDKDSHECFITGAGTALGRAHSRQWTLLAPADRRRRCSAPQQQVPRFDYSQPGTLPLS